MGAEIGRGGGAGGTPGTRPSGTVTAALSLWVHTGAGEAALVPLTEGTRGSERDTPYAAQT